jgi:hypothetical protein
MLSAGAKGVMRLVYTVHQLVLSVPVTYGMLSAGAKGVMRLVYTVHQIVLPVPITYVVCRS